MSSRFDRAIRRAAFLGMQPRLNHPSAATGNLDPSWAELGARRTRLFPGRVRLAHCDKHPLNSLGLARLVVAPEEELGTEIAPAEIEGAQFATPRKIVEFVESLVRASSTPRSAPRSSQTTRMPAGEPHRARARAAPGADQCYRQRAAQDGIRAGRPPADQDANASTLARGDAGAHPVAHIERNASAHTDADRDENAHARATSARRR